MIRSGIFPVLVPGIVVILLALMPAPARVCFGQQADAYDYNRDIRPILSDKCFFCHGPDASRREGNLRLDIRQEALDSGVIDTVDPDRSLILERILSTDDEEKMPPPASHKSLDEIEKNRLAEWVRQGAVYDVHWAYQPVQRPVLPPGNPASHPVDAFIYAALEEAGIQPLPRADGRTLSRRLAFDLLGLPPTPAEAELFHRDPSPEAWQKLVDEFLSKPQFGERMATPWLDVVRYADTVGYHGDQNQNAWAYRDWVIEAFNRNLPFDRFTVEQLAGDLLPEPSPDQLVATCFNRLNMVTREGGAQPEEYIARYMADRVRTVSTAWLGLTMGCAECHDHKYDPSTSGDFYSLGAFFADIRQWGVYHDYPYTPNKDLRGFSNDHPFPPELEIESEFLHRRLDELKQEQIALATRVSADDGGLSDWLEKTKAWLVSNPDGWQSVAPMLSPETEKGISIENATTVRFQPDAESMVSFPLEGQIASLRLELLPVKTVEDKPASIRRDNSFDGFRLNPEVAVLRSGVAKPEIESVSMADSKQKSPIYSNGFEQIGISRGWQTASADQAHAAVIVFQKPVHFVAGDRLRVSLRDDKKVAAIRVSISPLAPQNPESLEDTVVPQTDNDWALARVRATGIPEEVFKSIRELDKEILNCRQGKTPVLVTCSVEPAVTRILPRGNWQDKSGTIVQPAVPHFLSQPEGMEGKRLNRLDLAQWLMNRDNPLVARVIMNRLWMQFFGEGLVVTPDDFGSQGANPSHPALLDWLASEFRESGWDLKHMCRLIVTSQAYQRSSATGQDPPEADPENRLLWRQRPRRLTAEMVRDNALAISGLLDLEPGGPPIRPLQPEGYYAHLQFPDRSYEESGERDRYRRSVYIHWQRTFLHPILLGFDALTREDCVAMRNEANNPQQALALLNDPAMVELAAAFAERLLKENPDATPDERIDMAIQQALLRPATDQERESLKSLFAQLTDHYGQDEELASRLASCRRYTWRDTSIDPVTLAVWTNLARVILNLHETITRY